MANQANLELFQRAFTAFAAGDADTLGEVFDEDVVWHQPGSNALSGEHRGQAATFAMFGGEFELSNGTIRPELREAVATDDTVVALLRTSAQRADRQALDQDVVLTFTVRDGRLAEGWTVWTDPTAADTFWS